MSRWFDAIPDNDNPTTQGHIVFLRNNPAIFKIFERTLMHMHGRNHYGIEVSMLSHYRQEHDAGKITDDEHLYHRFSLALRYEHFNNSLDARDNPLVQGYMRLLDDMFELRPEVLMFFYYHFVKARQRDYIAEHWAKAKRWQEEHNKEKSHGH